MTPGSVIPFPAPVERRAPDPKLGADRLPAVALLSDLELAVAAAQLVFLCSSILLLRSLLLLAGEPPGAPTIAPGHRPCRTQGMPISGPGSA